MGRVVSAGPPLNSFKTYPRVHRLCTPIDAARLDQAESLLEAFEEQYLLRGSWQSRTMTITPMLTSCDDYNQSSAMDLTCATQPPAALESSASQFRAHTPSGCFLNVVSL